MWFAKSEGASVRCTFISKVGFVLICTHLCVDVKLLKNLIGCFYPWFFLREIRANSLGVCRLKSENLILVEDFGTEFDRISINQNVILKTVRTNAFMLACLGTKKLWLLKCSSIVNTRERWRTIVIPVDLVWIDFIRDLWDSNAGPFDKPILGSI